MGWMYISRAEPYDRPLIDRLAVPVAGLIDLAVEREEAARRASETEAASRAEAAKTAILHAISHDLRSPLTAISTAVSALRTAGVEVWFDQCELVGGDVWDAKIRKQIAECALFVPVISASTQARLEGYFRIEWDLAAER